MLVCNFCDSVARTGFARPPIKEKTMIYLDHAATTSIRPPVYEALNYWYSSGKCGNPSSLHSAGRQAHQAIYQARFDVSKLIGADSPEEIIFTSGGSESDNLALTGMASALNATNHNVMLVSQIEHHAILNQCNLLTRLGIVVKPLSVDTYGQVDLFELEKYLKEDNVGLVSVMWVNNEIGVIQDIKSIADLCNCYGAVFHTDAVQAVGHIDVNVNAYGIDMLSISGHKFGAPIGVGALYVRGGLKKHIEPIIYGGGQEFGVRAGTENVAGIVALGTAAMFSIPTEFSRDALVLRKAFLKKLYSVCDEGIKVNEHYEKSYQLSSILSITINDVESEAILHLMNSDGVCISAASACSAGSLEPSHVLSAIGRNYTQAKSTIRVSFGWNTTVEEVTRAAELLGKNIVRIRKMYRS
jgi:cysteine desulfurase